MDMVKVEGMDGLVKDTSTNTVINSDSNAFLNHKMAKKRILDEQREKDDLKLRLEKVEALLQQVLNKESTNEQF